jgi:hypothetical protein
MKSEVISLLNRIKEESAEREVALKNEQKERQEQLRIEQRERNDALSAERRELHETIAKEQRDRTEATGKLFSDLSNTNEILERKTGKLIASLDGVERTLRELLMAESGNLNDKIEEKYNESLNIIDKTAAHIRSDMVYRTALSTMFTEIVASLSKPWNLDISPDSQDEDEVFETTNSEENQQSNENQDQGDNENRY